jgi:hypothetical protein
MSLSDITKRKFIDSIDLNDFEVLTDTGFEDIKSIHKTIPYQLYELIGNKTTIKGANTHIIFDENWNQKYLKDFKPADKYITKFGVDTVVELKIHKEADNMYDLTLSENSNQRYYTNGILSHNTNGLCSMSIGYVKKGYNVLYISGEMGDTQIAKMLYANLMGIPRNDMESTSESTFMGNHDVFKLKSASWGRYFVKEFPPASVNMKQIEAYIHDLQLKTGIVFNIIMLDYLNLFLPITGHASDNTYTSIKRVSEEYRALCVVNNLAGVTATQTNRDGAKTSDLEMTDTSESFGLPATMDAMIGIIGTTDLKKQNMQIWKLIKNRMTGIIDYKIPVRTQFEFGRVIDLADKTDVPINIDNNPVAKNMANKLKSMKMSSGITITLDSDEKRELETLLT